MKPLQDEARQLNQLLLTNQLPTFRQALADVSGLEEVAAKRVRTKQAMGLARRTIEKPGTAEDAKERLKTQLTGLTNVLVGLDSQLAETTSTHPEAKKAVLDREKTLGLLAANRAKQEPSDDIIKKRGNTVQLWQEMGGLAGRIALAVLVVLAVRRTVLIRLFLLPGIFLFAITYLEFYKSAPEFFAWGIAACGFLTVAQFSYMGEFLPKVFPVHLRGTGGSFATNVGGRMIGTSAAFLTTQLAAKFGGSTFDQVATAAGIVGTSVFVLGFALSFLLPEPVESKEG